MQGPAKNADGLELFLRAFRCFNSARCTLFLLILGLDTAHLQTLTTITSSHNAHSSRQSEKDKPRRKTGLKTGRSLDIMTCPVKPIIAHEAE